MTDIATVPFKDLKAVDEINARSTTKDGLDELAASIASRGLIQPLAVRPSDGGKYEIIDGRRRYQAIAKLVKSKTLKKDHAVPVLVRNEDDVAALETSLAANTVRLPMHPVDQHAVFARLEQQGRSVDEIATGFGLTAKTVRQRLALSKLAQPIRDAWKKGKLETQVAQAFADHPDHEVQAELYSRLKREGTWGLREDRIRSELTKGRENVDCGAMTLVGVDAYLEAGGTLTESLFIDESYVDDVPLLNKLVRDRVQAECSRFTSEGWGWSAFAEDLPKGWGSDSWHYWEEIDEDRAQGENPEFAAEEKARSGVVIEVEHDGTLTYYWGVIRPDGAEAASQDDDDSDQVDIEDAINTASAPSAEQDLDDNEVEDDDQDDDADPKISAALLETITTAQTIAAGKALEQFPDLALRVAVAALMSEPWDSPAKISIGGTTVLPRPAYKQFANNWQEVSGWKTERVQETLANLVGRSLSLVAHNSSRRRLSERALVAAIPGDAYLLAMRESFNPADYFKRASKAVALAALEEMEEAGAIRSLSADLSSSKHAELADFASRNASRCGWLPPELSHPDYALIVADQEEAA